MKRVAIAGGGITGLGAAFTLEQARRRGAQVEYTLYQGSTRPGGIVHTLHREGFVLEAGPDSFITEKPWAAEICRELGIEDRLIGSNDAERKTYIALDGRLAAMPEGMQLFVPGNLEAARASELFSESTRRTIEKEKSLAPRGRTEDEPAEAFVERHFGREMVERVAAPMLAGVYGGSATRLSRDAVLPRFAALEAEQGSLIRALEKKKSAAQPAPIFMSLKNGMEELVDALVARIAIEDLRKSAQVKWIERKEGHWRIEAVNCDVQECDFIILALPAFAAAELLAPLSPTLAQQLDAIPYSSAATVSLAYGPEVTPRRLPPGFGFLVPQSENSRLLACTFVHNKFPGRAPAGRVLLRAFLGGPSGEAALALSDSEMVSTVQSELRRYLGLAAAPLYTHIERWPRSMPQYEVGHLLRVGEIEKLRRQLPGLELAGSAYRGVGVPDCIREGWEAARRILAA